MKPSSLILLISILVSSLAYSQTEFCKGWESGFKEGYCYDDYGCVSPVAPVCPIANAGENSYKDGYNRGFLAGKKEKENGNNSGGGVKGQLKPIKSDYGNKIRDYVRKENELKAERQASRNKTLPYFNEAKEKAVKAFNKKDYWECIKQYNSSKNLGWHNSEFELMAGISYGMIWKESKDRSHLKQAKKLMKLAKKHGHPNAKELLKKLKKAEKEK